ncbi:hypothetical protein Dsin_030280 [Dipteronia sinensis]|uniref:RING-type E3 ubiquitin transferase n=1 Tax=Dipteronia sinensis TaxID=43782 RepID=A0AAD9ZKL4_9ROSI|nr:hypothetical protein Dsin_030280 [Dipteronia sinensis]
MGSMGNPKTWVPYVNGKDCSQGFCSLYCPQWCYIIFPPPPPIEFPDDNTSSSPNFSPLVIAIIGILASAFLLVSYYSIISKYCGNTNSSRRRENDDPVDQELVRDNVNPSLHEPWHATATGLDEALIKSITMCKYKKGDGLIEGSDCSVCLSEFEEDESLRLLPKCSHAFHVQCIDTWLKSHSNCPLCRANIFFISASPPQLAPQPIMAETPPNHSQGASEEIAATQDRERDAGEEDHQEMIHNNDLIPKTPQVRAFSDLGNLQGRDIVIEIRDEGCQEIRRSVSMDHSCQRSSVSIAQVLLMNQDDDVIEEEEFPCNHAGSSKQSSSSADDFVKCSHNKRKIMHCVMNPVAMKRSISSGRPQGRVRDAIVPL